MTIEDPVEYVFPSINQIQINEQAGLTFATGLKSILRQDPDVILVGEIRDVETARIAVQSALTGHFVLSSLHATDAVAALHRFLDMGIESFLIASSVLAVVGQRLVRRICTSCKTSYTPTAEELAFYEESGGKAKETFFHGAGCNFCAGTGYQDRIGVYELLRITPEIKRLVVGWATQDELRRMAVQQGMRTLARRGHRPRRGRRHHHLRGHPQHLRALEDSMAEVRVPPRIPQAFPSFYVSVLRSAELTGNLDVVLDQLAEYIERDVDARQKVTSALAYPAVIFVMAIVTAAVLTIFVIPKFETFFDSLDAELPAITRALLAVSGFMGDYGLFMAVGLVAFVALLALSYRTTRGKAIYDRVLLRMPGLGPVLQEAILERFCRVLASMVSAGVPLPDALAVTADVTNNDVYRRGLVTAREAMLRGEGLAQPLAATNLFPGAARQMFRVGEETGTLDTQL